MEISKIFEDLRYHHENEVVEFKKAESSFDFDDLGKYFSALSNEANLRGKSLIWLSYQSLIALFEFAKAETRYSPTYHG